MSGLRDWVRRSSRRTHRGDDDDVVDVDDDGVGDDEEESELRGRAVSIAIDLVDDDDSRRALQSHSSPTRRSVPPPRAREKSRADCSVLTRSPAELQAPPHGPSGP